VLDQVGCDLTPEPITTIDVVMLDGSAWQIVLSAPLVTGVIAQPSGNLTIDGGDPVNITVWDGPPPFGRFHLSPTEPAEVLEVHLRTEGLRAEIWKLESGYITWIETPSGEAVVITGEPIHDFASELVAALAFDGQGFRLESDRFAIVDLRLDASLPDPSALFASTTFILESDCIIAPIVSETCGPPTLSIDSNAPAQSEAVSNATLRPAT